LPIVGDLGHKEPAYFENNPLTYPDDSLFLHAWKLEFTNPITHQRIEVISRVNEKWNNYLD